MLTSDIWFSNFWPFSRWRVHQHVNVDVFRDRRRAFRELIQRETRPPSWGRAALEGRLANLTSCRSYPPVWAGGFHVNSFRCGTFVLICRPMTWFAYSGTLAGKVSASGEEQLSRVGSFSSLNNPVKLFMSLFLLPIYVSALSGVTCVTCLLTV